MKIERVDEKTVKCFLSNEELEEYNIDYKDFVLRSEKAKEVVQDIIEHAEEEVGYKPPKFAFDLQIMVLPEKGLVLTFSEKEPADFKEGEHLMECLKEIKEVLQKTREKTGIAMTEQNPELGKHGEKEALQGEALPHKLVKRPEFAVFRFENMRNMMAFAFVLPGNLRVQSALYEMSGVYYLYLNKGTASYERYSRACIQAMEFGSLYAAEPEKVLFLEEHGQCLIPEKALKKLRLN